MLPIMPFRESEPQIKQAHPAEARPEGIAKHGQESAHGPGHRVRKPTQKLQQGARNRGLNLVAERGISGTVFLFQ